MTAKNRVAALELELADKQREVDVLEGRVRGYQAALLTKAEVEAKAKFNHCNPGCGAIWLNDSVPTHRFQCPEWIQYFNHLERKSGYIVGVKLAPVRPRLKRRASSKIACAVLHHDRDGNPTPCPGHR